jgi:hypothetical protein
MFEQIERLKAEWTDKYVVVDARAPELARFARATGQVKTVNMNGRCLVEFDQYNNTAWYDIDPTALKVVPKPQPKPAEPKEKAKPAAAKPAAAKPAATKPAAAKPAPAKLAAGGAKLSTADILARARGAAAAKPAATPPPAPAEEPPEEAAAPEPVAPAPKAKTPAAAGAMPTTTADKIAWCRAHDAKG